MVLEVDVLKVTRLKNTGSGNPQFLFETSAGSYQTYPDSNLNHWITPEQRFVGKRILISVEGKYIRNISEKG